MWTVRARFDGSTKQLHEVDPNATVQTLKQRLANQFPGLPADGHIILSGFPPAPLVGDDSTTVQDAGVSHCGTLQLHLSSASGVVTQAPKREKRARKRSVAEGDESGGLPSAAQPEEAGAWMDRLGSGLVEATSPYASDVSDSVRQFRQTLGKELAVRQEERRASQRLEAALGGTVVISPCTTAFRLGGGLPMFRYTFPISSRKSVDEDHLAMPKGILAHLIKAIAADKDLRERLRPANMALYSPRVFWNVVRHFSGAGFEDGLQELVPSADWSFLEHRIRNLSEKALQHHAQKEEAKKRRLMRAQKRARAADPPATLPKVAEAARHTEDLEATAAEGRDPIAEEHQ